MEPMMTGAIESTFSEATESKRKYGFFIDDVLVKSPYARFTTYNKPEHLELVLERHIKLSIHREVSRLKELPVPKGSLARARYIVRFDYYVSGYLFKNIKQIEDTFKKCIIIREV